MQTFFPILSLLLIFLFLFSGLYIFIQIFRKKPLNSSVHIIIILGIILLVTIRYFQNTTSEENSIYFEGIIPHASCNKDWEHEVKQAEISEELKSVHAFTKIHSSNDFPETIRIFPASFSNEMRAHESHEIAKNRCDQEFNGNWRTINIHHKSNTVESSVCSYKVKNTEEYSIVQGVIPINEFNAILFFLTSPSNFLEENIEELECILGKMRAYE